MQRREIRQRLQVIKKFLILAAGFFSLGSLSAYALDPDEILLVANSQLSGSMDLARCYMKKRNILRDRLLSVSVFAQEVISHEEYEKESSFQSV